jgi:hypothetical protein
LRCSPAPGSPAATSSIRIPEPRPATITGELSYPSDYIPEDMRVCAEDVALRKRNCDARFTTRNGRRLYTLTMPPGSYLVYAETRDMPDYKAYYSEAVVCGLSVDCLSHEPIMLELRAGENRSKVHPQDWYARK